MTSLGYMLAWMKGYLLVVCVGTAESISVCSVLALTIGGNVEPTSLGLALWALLGAAVVAGLTLALSVCMGEAERLILGSELACCRERNCDDFSGWHRKTNLRWCSAWRFNRCSTYLLTWQRRPCCARKTVNYTWCFCTVAAWHGYTSLYWRHRMSTMGFHTCTVGRKIALGLGWYSRVHHSWCMALC